MQYQGDYAEDATVYIMFNTFTSDDPSASSTITNFTNTDVHIHKDDGLTQRNNAAGITVSVDFDGITGSHMIKIDTSDDTVAAFWVTGSDYFVRIEGTTVDGATINAVVGHFSIENRFNEVDVTKILGHLLTQTGTQLADGFEKFFDVATPTGTVNSLPGAAPDAAGGLPVSDAGGLDLDAKLANTNEVTAARMGALTDWIDGGRLDLILDIIAADVANIDGAAMVAEAPTAAQNRTEMDTNSTQLTAIVGDTDELQTDLTNGGRLDLLIDAIKAMTDNLPNSGALTDIDTGINNLETRLSADRGTYLDELAAANIPADIDTLLTRITALIATKAEMDTAHALLATPAQVNTQVSDVVKTDTYTLPGQGAPTATPTLETALMYLYKQFRNKETQTATEYKLMADDGTTADQKSAVSDDGTTYTKGELTTGA